MQEVSASRLRNYWWVNQGDTFDDEIRKSCIYASAGGDGRADYQHHRNIMRLQRHDVIFHYTHGHVAAISLVREVQEGQPRPYVREGYENNREGYLALVEYYVLPAESQISLDEIPTHWRVREGSPFNRHGDVKQQYLNPLTGGFAHMLIGLFYRRLPEIIWPLPLLEGISAERRARS